MNLLIDDISKLSFKLIKEEINNINLQEIYKSNDFHKLVDILTSDSRKNVTSLGIKLKRDREKLENEKKRIKSMYDFDKSFGDYEVVAGVDEVGRGPLAGPIVSCAVVLDLNALEEDFILELNDSKKLSEKKREELSVIIKEKALAYKIAYRTSNEIDEKGIGVCNNEIFLEACNSLDIKPRLVLSDGYAVKGLNIDNKAVIKGDTKSASIAAASIVAKVYRDNLMKEYAEKYPYYGFEANVGYGSSKHIEAIKKHGPCEIHRRSFLNNILEINKS